jgi:protein-tyrosine phosphatase
MVDIHCHILPGIDDGPNDIHESIHMSEIAARDGITTIVATPHVNNALTPLEEIKERIDQLNGSLIDRGIPVEVLQGADVSALIDISLLEGYTINNTKYILIEFPGSHIPLNAGEIIFTLVIKGYRPIISHPERNPSIIRDPGILDGLIQTGALVQVTAESLTGDFGPDIQECVSALLKKGTVNFIATDAHSSSWRRPVLSGGLRMAEKILGKEKAYALVSTNPRAVLAGKPLDD